MLVILLLILLLITLSGQSIIPKQVEIVENYEKVGENENIVEPKVDKIEPKVDKIEPTGLEEDSHWANYNQSAIPKITYRTNRDIVAPPKIAVEINCPECPDNWE